MKRYCAWAISVSLWMGMLSGCASSELRIVEAFEAGLAKKDIAAVREATSADFESKALSHGEPWHGLEQMEFPDGKTRVLKVEEARDDQGHEIKKVTVEVGKQKVVYRLKKETPSQKWVIDDVFLNHRQLDQDKSVATQLHVQVSAVETVNVWRQGDRGRILATATNDLKQTLSELPTERLPMLASQLISDIPPGTNAKGLEIIEDQATARFSKSKGDLVLQLRRQNGQWMLEDLRVDSREGESISSVRRLAAASTSAIAFYSAYQSSDKRSLQRLCTQDFFNSTIKVADLTQLRLPLPVAGNNDFKTSLEGPAAEVTVIGNNQTVKISLSGNGEESPKVIPRYQVREVTVYDLKTRQDMRLSTVFNGRAVMQIYSEALQKRDLATLKSLSTADFCRRVWDRTSPDTLLLLPLDEIEEAEPQLESSVYRSAVTRLTVIQGSTPLAFVLRDVAGKTLVDDVEIPSTDRNMTLKTRLELMLPIVEFAEGFRRPSLELLRANSSKSFSRSVWNQVKKIPRLDASPDQFLSAPLSRIVQNPEGAIVSFGDENYGAKVSLKRDGDQFVIEDMTLIAGPAPRQRVQLLQVLRTRIANGADLHTEEETPRASNATFRNLPENAALESKSDLSDVETR